MSLVISSVFTYDEDASDYILAVEAVDGPTLEPLTRKAINDFVLGCKADGIWTALQACCILAGARTLAGALVPLRGPAPTNMGPFVSGDYDRVTGLKGDGATKYLDSNRNNNADGQDNVHQSVYVTTLPTINVSLLGAGLNTTGATHANSDAFRNRSPVVAIAFTAVAGFRGHQRNNSSTMEYRTSANSGSVALASQLPSSEPCLVFARGTTGAPASISNARLSYYSIGSALDLAKLDARVTQLMAKFAAVIV